MAEQVRVEEVTREEQMQDCGCGCGGAVCESDRQKVIWVTSPKSMATQELNADQCDCGCSGR